jgi:nucleotide-binding universal stress UspA family protein
MGVISMKASFPQLLVHLDGSANDGPRLASAAAIAQSQGAAVTALYAVTPALVTLPFAAEAGASVATVLGEMDGERRSAARAAFDAATSSQFRAEWAEVADYPITSSFARQALYADLLILGQHDPSDSSSAAVPADFPEAVMAASGKPALVLPYQSGPATVAQNVVIAWKPTREAALAVSAAVPLLQRARSVKVVSWLGPDSTSAGERLDLARYLKLRGVDAVWHQEVAEPEHLGDVLLSRCFDLGADLLVMGCYGHSRAREWVLGGTSRTILRSMTLPVLMAH